MQFWNFFSFFFLSILVPFTVGQLSGSARHSRHNELAKRQSGTISAHLFKSTRWTWFAVGLGACGKTNVESDYIVAMNAQQFGEGYPGPHCFKTITMTCNGKTTEATVTDRCPGCPYGGLDLSVGLFRYFAPLSVGVLTGEWSFTDGSGGGTF